MGGQLTQRGRERESVSKQESSGVVKIGFPCFSLSRYLQELTVPEVLHGFHNSVESILAELISVYLDPSFIFVSIFQMLYALFNRLLSMKIISKHIKTLYFVSF